MTPADRELAEAARMHEWLREVDAVQAPGAYNIGAEVAAELHTVESPRPGDSATSLASGLCVGAGGSQ